jgi:pilus assembly protein Flp/PilA
MRDLSIGLAVRIQTTWGVLRERLRDREGQTMVEYGLLIAGIVLATVVAIAVLGPKIRDLFDRTSSELDKLPAK